MKQDPLHDRIGNLIHQDVTGVSVPRACDL
jgi:hypothetical protein